jgi:hypothetical protein
MNNLIKELDYLIYRSLKLLNKQKLLLDDKTTTSKKVILKKDFDKKQIIYGWLYQGMIDPFNDDCETIYNRYMNTTNCDLCNISFSDKRKCMEHDHKTGLFRNIVCCSCNIKISFKERVCTNNTGIYSLYYQYYKRNNEWLFVYNKQCNKDLRIYKKFKEVEDAVAFVVINQIIMKLEGCNIVY